MTEVQLGFTVKDKITGFKGIAVAKVEYLTGCTQFGVAPPVGKDGKMNETLYFDYSRLEVIGKKSVIAHKPTTRGGPNRDCPR